MTYLSAASAPVHELVGNTFTGLAAPSRGSRENAAWRVKVPAGHVSDGSHQLSREELIIAVSGAAVALLGDTRHNIAAGDTIIVPPFTDFRLDNPHDTPFEAIAVLPVGGRAILPGTAPFVPPWAV